MSTCPSPNRAGNHAASTAQWRPGRGRDWGTNGQGGFQSTRVTPPRRRMAVLPNASTMLRFASSTEISEAAAAACRP